MKSPRSGSTNNSGAQRVPQKPETNRPRPGTITVQSKSHLTSTAVYAVVILCLGLNNLSCSSSTQTGAQAPEPSTVDMTNDAAAAIWDELLQKSPYPHAAPLPPAERTSLDGTYVKIDPKKTPPVPCRRCPDYAPQGGIWKLNLDRGVFRIFHEFTGWRSIGSFRVDGARATFFNDPYCMAVFGTYDWKLIGGRLQFQVVKDECAIRLRAKTLVNIPWLSCRMLTIETGGGEGRKKPPGCD